MSIEIIPSGASAVVTDHHNGGYRRDNCREYGEILGTIKDAEANLAAEEGNHYADTVKTVKDAEANLAADSGWHFADTVKSIKDAEAQLARSAGAYYADTVKTIKDTEAQLDRAAGDRFINLVQDVKDAETRLDRAAGDRFINLVQDVKDAETRTEKNSGDRFISTTKDIFNSRLTTEEAKAKVLSAVKDAELEGIKAEHRTREEMFKEFCSVKERVEHAREKVLLDQLKEFKEAQGLSWKLWSKSEKTADTYATATALAFKDQAIMSEKLFAASQRQLDECCCELKQLIASDGQKTRDLMNMMEQDRLREKAQKAEAQLAAYFARGVPPVTPVV